MRSSSGRSRVPAGSAVIWPPASGVERRPLDQLNGRPAAGALGLEGGLGHGRAGVAVPGARAGDLALQRPAHPLLELVLVGGAEPLAPVGRDRALVAALLPELRAGLLAER